MTRFEGLKIRPLPPSKTNDVFKIFLSPANLQGIKVGSICNITSAQGPVGPAIAWNATEKIQDDVVQISRTLQSMYGLKLESRVSISPSNESFADALDITFHEIAQDVTETQLPPLHGTERQYWEWVLSKCLKKVGNEKVTSPGLRFENVDVGGEKRSFQIQCINSSDERLLYSPILDCRTRLQEETVVSTLYVSSDGIGGLDKQMQEINDIVKCYELPRKGGGRARHFQGGLLIHGAPGTGKTLVLSRIAEAGWRAVYHIDSKMLKAAIHENGATVTRVFSNALRTQPSVVIIDSFDSFEAKNDAPGPGKPVDMGHLLGDEIDRCENNRVLVVGAARRILNVDERFRLAPRFIDYIEIPIPDLECRTEQLRVIAGLPKEKPHPILDSVSTRASGFVGSDLKTLCAVASRRRVIRKRRSTVGGEVEVIDEDDNEGFFANMDLDFDNALSSVHPTVMRGISFERPDVNFDDIVGHSQVKKELRHAVVWPLKYPNILKRRNLTPKKGLLLYGPPGCSKTMAGRAAAANSGSNFIIVKGSELDSMYVGESERALRDIFRKALSTKPSMIFFDEFDAIGAKRGSAGVHAGVHTVETLLNEMDGFQKTEGVFVLAATNNPEIIDPALLRGGRFGKALHVGLPEKEDRRKMFGMKILTIPSDHQIDVDALADVTEGYSGADITQICEEAGYAALEEQGLHSEAPVCQRHFDEALRMVQKSVTSAEVERCKKWSIARNKFD